MHELTEGSWKRRLRGGRGIWGEARVNTDRVELLCSQVTVAHAESKRACTIYIFKWGGGGAGKEEGMLTPPLELEKVPLQPPVSHSQNEIRGSVYGRGVE